jgi:hypothetical protein
MLGFGAGRTGSAQSLAHFERVKSSWGAAFHKIDVVGSQRRKNVVFGRGVLKPASGPLTLTIAYPIPCEIILLSNSRPGQNQTD